MSYLILDTTDDTVLAECESLHDARPVLDALQKEQPGRELIVVWFGEQRGELSRGQSFVNVRTLSDAEGSALYGP